MKSLGTEKFWKAYHAHPSGIKEAARAAHKKFLISPAHPSLQLERLRSDPRFWSVRVTRDYRAVAQRFEDDLWVWVWVGILTASFQHEKIFVHELRPLRRHRQPLRLKPLPPT